jgi:hypothetical protein
MDYTRYLLQTMSIVMQKYIMNHRCHEKTCIIEEKLDKVRCEIKPHKIIKMVRIHHKARRNDIDHLIQVGRLYPITHNVNFEI